MKTSIETPPSPSGGCLQERPAPSLHSVNQIVKLLHLQTVFHFKLEEFPDSRHWRLSQGGQRLGQQSGNRPAQSDRATSDNPSPGGRSDHPTPTHKHTSFSPRHMSSSLCPRSHPHLDAADQVCVVVMALVSISSRQR